MEPAAREAGEELQDLYNTPNLPTNIVDFRGVDSSIMLFLRGGISRPIENSAESLSQAMLAGTMLVGRLGAYNITSHYIIVYHIILCYIKRNIL